MSLSLEDWNDAAKYERWYRTSLGQAYSRSVNAIVRPWIERARPSFVVDVGCGPGLTAEAVVDPDARLVALDCSFAMASAAGRRLERDRRVSSAVGACTAIPLRSSCADLVLCVNCLEFVPSRERAFGELRRVLRPGGHAVIGVLNRGSLWEITRRLRAPFMEHDHAYYRSARFFTPDELRCSLEAAGLRVEALEFGVHFPPLRSPVSSLYAAFERTLGRWAQERGGMILALARA